MEQVGPRQLGRAVGGALALSPWDCEGVSSCESGAVTANTGCSTRQDLIFL